MSKTVLFQTIQFCISTQFSSIWPITSTPGQSGHGSQGNEEVLCISQSSRITGTLPSDCLGSYLGHSLPLSRGAVCVFSSPSWLGKNRIGVFYIMVRLECLYQMMTLGSNIVSWFSHNTTNVVFWPFDPAKDAIQGDAPEGSDTF